MSVAREIIARVRGEGRLELTENESKQVLASIGVEVTREELGQNQDSVVAIAERLGYPVVLKISSPDILHKSDVGGVRVGLANADAVRRGYQQILQSVKAKHRDAAIDGILVCEMVSGGIETIIGVTNLPPFGPTVAFGLGGVFVEVLKDITFRTAPIDQAESSGMLLDINGVGMLDGVRGREAGDKALLADAID